MENDPRQPVQRTLQQLIDQWVPGGSGAVQKLKLQHNVTDFTTNAGQFVKEQFKKSFETQRFLGIGEIWPESKMSKKHGHTTMFDHGQLAGMKSDKELFNSDYRKKIHLRKNRYSIWTAEESYFERKKRGLNKTKGHSYAAAHNDPKAVGAKVNQKEDRLQTQRKFMGHHQSLFEGIAQYYPMIFDRIPQ